ncbi:MAG TPA: hypothetical protein VFA89_20915 [Terriglobales bacterium]|nr:hypothetical protein [Terriglobales bacterium]
MISRLTKRQQPIPTDVLKQIREIQMQHAVIDERREQLYRWLMAMIEQGHRV